MLKYTLVFLLQCSENYAIIYLYIINYVAIVSRWYCAVKMHNTMYDRLINRYMQNQN